MPMTKTGIEYLTHTWQIIIGCRHGCSYCYSRNRWAPRRIRDCALCASFTPHIHAERLGQVRRRIKPARIGLGFHSDLFGDWDWIKVGDSEPHIHLHPLGVYAMIAAEIEHSSLRHVYVTLTKNPTGIPTDLPLPANWMIGVSVTLERDTLNADNKRMFDLFGRVPESQRMLSIAPCRAETPLAFSDLPFGWIVVEGESGKRAHGVTEDTVEPLIKACEREGVPIWIKDNALLPGYPQQLPEMLILPWERDDAGKD